ncbi:MAG: DUF3179 domain-containing protein [Chloroflexi bacterium]|nr:MAG: DUF3179 domain-containing protein [Chloroflexota bacterium]
MHPRTALLGVLRRVGRIGEHHLRPTAAVTAIQHRVLRRTPRARSRVPAGALHTAGGVALLACALGGCAVPSGARPTPTVAAVFQPGVTSTPAAASTAPALPSGEMRDALRDVICWYDDPSKARECMAHGEATQQALIRIAASGDRRFIAPLVDMLWMDLGWERSVREALEMVSGQRYATAADWYAAIERDPPPLPDGYGEWKGRLLSVVDTRFMDLVPKDGSSMRLERLIWAFGDTRSPTITSAKTIRASEERYLAAGDIMFGLRLNGDSRAYPERVLAWHGVAQDRAGGSDIVVFHCLPCGGAAAYRRAASDGRSYTFGIANLVTGSRRLVFDAETMSLWDPVNGRAVAGPLATKNVSLTSVPMTRTAWGEWKDRYPAGVVLALDTGFVRDYAEGAALRGEGGLERPQFPFASLDPRFAAKVRVVGVNLGGVWRAYPIEAVEQARVVQETVAGVTVVLLSAGPGKGVQVYDAQGTRFERVSGAGAGLEVSDREGGRWFIDDERLLNTRNGRTRPALPSTPVWWFAWAGAHPDTTIWKP